MGLAAPVTLQRGDGACAVSFTRDRQGRTRVANVYQHDPCRVLFPTPEPGDLPVAALVTTSGGLAGGDRVSIALTADAGSSALATTQAAEKVYRPRQADADTRIAVSLRVAEGAWLEWLPQETILFDGARLRRDTDAEVAPGGRLLAGEFLVLGRSARGERLTAGLLHDRWRLVSEGRLIWTDALRLGGPAGWDALEAPAGLAGATALFTLVYAAADAPDRLERVRERIAEATGRHQPGEIRAGATLLGPVLVARLLGRRAHTLRGAVAALWTSLRAEAAGLPAALPRLWWI